MMDVYQDRYLEHRSRKTATLAGEVTVAETGSRAFDFCDKWPLLKHLMETRRSQRRFNGKQVSGDQLKVIAEAIWLSPSSCNRQAITTSHVTSKWLKEELSKLLVGGKGWVDKADIVVLLFANPDAYKAPGEMAYMPYLDAGVCVQSAYLAAEAMGVGCCFVNPNIREEDRAAFAALFETLKHDCRIFCGALALGHYDVKAPEPPRRAIDEVFE
jgi:nitroreductase